MNGVNQWLFQRASNLIFIVAGLVLAALILCSQDSLSYAGIKDLLNSLWFQIAAVIVLLAAVVNSVLAGWQIIGDYAKKFNLPGSLIIALVIVISCLTLILGLDVIFIK